MTDEQLPDEITPITEIPALDGHKMDLACLSFPCGIDLISVEQWFRDHAEIAKEMMLRYRILQPSIYRPAPAVNAQMEAELFDARKVLKKYKKVDLKPFSDKAGWKFMTDAVEAHERFETKYAEQAMQPVTVDAEERAWLIEHGYSEVSSPEYWNGQINGWTTDHLKACRFSRHRDAELVADLTLGGSFRFRICEHIWTPNSSEFHKRALKPVDAPGVK